MSASAGPGGEGSPEPWWRRDLKHPGWIVAKGLLFLLLGLMAATLVFLWPVKGLVFASLYAVSVWAFCRFYYFAFYVIGRYVDPEYRFSGLADFARWLIRRRRR